MNTDETLEWVVVSSPGDRLFGVETDGKFSLDHFDEGVPESFVREILERFVSIGLAYLNNAYETQRRGWLRTPILVVHAGDEVAELRRSVAAGLSGWSDRVRSLISAEPPIVMRNS